MLITFKKTLLAFAAVLFISVLSSGGALPQTTSPQPGTSSGVLPTGGGAAVLDPTTLVGFHTWVSLIALVAGLVVTGGLLRGRSLPGWTGVFLATAVATSITGFPLPATQFLPSHAFGIVALVTLPVAILARYQYRLAGAWRWIYIVTAITNVYLLAFVTVVQAFLKVPALNALAPTGSEAPLAVTQLVVLVLFGALTVTATRFFRPTLATRAYA